MSSWNQNHSPVLVPRGGIIFTNRTVSSETTSLNITHIVDVLIFNFIFVSVLRIQTLVLPHVIVLRDFGLVRPRWTEDCRRFEDVYQPGPTLFQCSAVLGTESDPADSFNILFCSFSSVLLHCGTFQIKWTLQKLQE